VVRAGCDWVVAGVTIFRSADPAATLAEMRAVGQALSPALRSA